MELCDVTTLNPLEKYWSNPAYVIIICRIYEQLICGPKAKIISENTDSALDWTIQAWATPLLVAEIYIKYIYFF